MRLTNCILFPLLCAGSLMAGDYSVSDYSSIQAALDANPGRVVYVPSGDYEISEKIRIGSHRSGLVGAGRIIQQNSGQPIIEIEKADAVQIRGLTLTRPDGRMETSNEGILAIRCESLVVEDVTVLDNQSHSAAIAIRECTGTHISHCLVRNYMRVSVDDRTASPEWGYAFNCTDGTGISVSHSTATLIESNRVIETRLTPTLEIKAQFRLGDFVKKNPEKGTVTNQQVWDAGYTENWQQGSGIIVTAPEVCDLTRIISNHIENAAQGIDLHADHVIVANNMVTNSFVGMKAMHGSRNVLITGNQFTRNSLWAIGLMPGAAAHPDNADGGSIIANNIISDFGYGDAHWIWGNERAPIRFDTGQQPDDPPLTDVIVQGNIVHSLGPPRYQYAVLIPGGPNSPKHLRFANNILHPGTAGISNQELNP